MALFMVYGLFHRRSAFAGVTDWFLLWCAAGRGGWLWRAGGDYRCAAGGLGFKPLYAAGLCLIANTAPVAFGALGVPILVAGQVTGIDPFHIGAMAGRQLPFLSVLVPFWLVAMMDGWKGVKETW